MLQATKLRDLTLASGEPPHIAAASGLVQVAGALYVIADDELFLGVFPSWGDAPGHKLPLGKAELPRSPARRKAAKPDLEALTLLPEHVFPPYGALLALGSGSGPNRRCGALLPLSQQGTPGAPSRIELGQLYDAIAQSLGGLNIEGATVTGDSLCLLQRAMGPGGVNALIQLDLAGLGQLLQRGTMPSGELVRKVQRYELGQVGNVRLGFTDACAVPGVGMVFSAVAEDAPDSYCDGPCVGGVIGLLDEQGVVCRMESLDPVVKVEGVDARRQGDTIALLLVADADDRSCPAPLYSARWTA